MTGHSSLLSDLVMILHFGWVLFNLFGFFIALKFPQIKYLHLMTLGLTAMIMLSGNVCPLTSMEQTLKMRSGYESAYKTSFLSHHIEKVLYLQVSPATITLITTLLAIAAIWFYLIFPYLTDSRSKRNP